MAKYAELKKIVDDASTDADKFYLSGNKAAGTRLRNTLQKIKTLAQEIRVEVGKIKKEKN